MGNDFTGEAAGDLGDDLVGLLDVTYCTITELRRYLSAQGVTDFADHDGDGAADSQVVADAINTATSTINDYVGQRYELSNISDSSASTTIKHWCRVLATYYLTQTRGNPVPDSFLNEWDRIANPKDGLLVLVRDGRYLISEIKARDQRPSFSNLTVDRRLPHSTIRVTRENSSDSPTELTQDVHRHHHGRFH